MFWKLLFSLLFFSPCTIVFSMSSNKLCINCQYFLKSTSVDNLYAKCTAVPVINENKISYLVTGNKEKKYYFCSQARSDEELCGKDGKKYRKKYKLETKK